MFRFLRWIWSIATSIFIDKQFEEIVVEILEREGTLPADTLKFKLERYGYDCSGLNFYSRMVEIERRGKVKSALVIIECHGVEYCQTRYSLPDKSL